MCLGKRIKNIREKLGLKQDKFANLLEIKNYQNVGNWENDINYPKDHKTLVKIAELGKVTLDWLLTGQESTFTPPISNLNELSPNAKEVDVQYYPVVARVTAGNYDIIVDSENVVEYMPLPIKRKNSFLLEVEGDSMTSEDKNKSIEPGDLLLVDTTEIPMHGDIVVVLITGGRQMVKQYFRNNGKVELRSYNLGHPPIYIEPDTIEVMYRVVYLQPKIKRL